MKVRMTSDEIVQTIRQWLADAGAPNGAAFDIRHADHGVLHTPKLTVEFSVEAPHMEGPYR
jgi:hypothetical protein